MNLSEAIQMANRWLGYLALQKARSERMQDLARLARTDPKEAQHEMRQMDQQPHVFDGAELEPAVRELLDEIKRLKEENEVLDERYWKSARKHAETTTIMHTEIHQLKGDVAELTEERGNQRAEITRLQVALGDEIARARAQVASKAEIERLREKNARLCRLAEIDPEQQ